MSNVISTVEDFMYIGRQETTKLCVKQLGLYFGLQCAELAEKLEALGVLGLSQQLDLVGDKLKEGAFSSKLANLTQARKIAFLDGDIDLLWASIGAAISLGADVAGAFREVASSNLSKAVYCAACQGDCEIDGEDCASCRGVGKVMFRDENGKIMKPKGYKKPELAGFLTRGKKV